MTENIPIKAKKMSQKYYELNEIPLLLQSQTNKFVYIPLKTLPYANELMTNPRAMPIYRLN